MTDFARDYALDQTLVDKLHYCGYLGRTGSQQATFLSTSGRSCSRAAAVGVDGSNVLEAFIRAAAELRPELGGSWHAVTGR